MLAAISLLAGRDELGIADSCIGGVVQDFLGKDIHALLDTNSNNRLFIGSL